MLQVDQKVLDDIGRGFSVPAQPELLVKLQQLMASPEPEINDISRIISQDIAVASTVLKTINSPIYGLSRSISDIHKACRFIGITGITSLVTNVLIQKSFEQQECSITLDDFWHNTQNIANTSVFIAKRLKHQVSIDKLFSLGLFHDCGIPVMAMKYPDYAETFEHATKTPSETLTSIEDSVYNVNHATIGYYVASSWRLPRDICQLILSHHDRNFLDVKADIDQQFYFAVLKLAENLVHNHKYFRDSADWPFLKDQILTTLDLDEDDLQDLHEDTLEIQR